MCACDRCLRLGWVSGVGGGGQEYVTYLARWIWAKPRNRWQERVTLNTRNATHSRMQYLRETHRRPTERGGGPTNSLDLFYLNNVLSAFKKPSITIGMEWETNSGVVLKATSKFERGVPFLNLPSSTSSSCVKPLLWQHCSTVCLHILPWGVCVYVWMCSVLTRNFDHSFSFAVLSNAVYLHIYILFVSHACVVWVCVSEKCKNSLVSRFINCSL